MKITKGVRLLVIAILVAGLGFYAFGFLGLGNSVRWKEEVLLHDGKKIVVERSQSYGGRHEIGQSSPIKERDIAFALPGKNETVTWTSEYSKDVGRTNFELLALHILKGTPYIVASPNLCLSYNKWGRPNPPYVFFKYDGKEWRRIPQEEFPGEIQTLNVTIETKGYEKELVRQEVVSAELVKKLNKSLRQPEYQRILREPLDKKTMDCPEMIRTGDGWLSIDWFSDKPTYEKCLKVCEREKVSSEQCPCDRLFKKIDKEK